MVFEFQKNHLQGKKGLLHMEDEKGLLHIEDEFFGSNFLKFKYFFLIFFIKNLSNVDL